MASDVVLIPVQPSPYDVWATGGTVALINETRRFKWQPRVVFAINRKILNTPIGRDVTVALAAFGLSSLPGRSMSA
jgi:chromosome partitioning protein